MTDFRCYFLDSSEHIEAAEDIDADAPGKAVSPALAMLRERPHHCAVWV